MRQRALSSPGLELLSTHVEAGMWTPVGGLGRVAVGLLSPPFTTWDKAWISSFLSRYGSFKLKPYIIYFLNSINIYIDIAILS